MKKLNFLGFMMAFGLMLAGCGGKNVATTPVQAVGDYGVRVEKFASQMQNTVAGSPLSDDVKARAMVGFRNVGVQIERLGITLSAYDAAMKLNQPVDGTDAAALAEQIKSGLLAVITIVRGGDTSVANQLTTTYSLVEQLLTELRTKLKIGGGNAAFAGGN